MCSAVRPCVSFLRLRSLRAPRPQPHLVCSSRSHLSPNFPPCRLPHHISITMAKLLDLPHELLLRITSFLDEKSDFLAFARSCRKLLPIGQDRFFTKITLNAIGNCDMPSSTAVFLRTLLAAPGLAKMVREIRITYVEGTIRHKCAVECRSRCVCGLRSVCRTSGQRIAACSGQNKHRVEQLLQAYEPAPVGAVLGLLPGLRLLEFDCRADCNPMTGGYVRELEISQGLKPTFYSTSSSLHVDMSQLFGGDVDLAWQELKATSRELERLCTIGTESWSFAACSSLCQLTIGLDSTLRDFDRSAAALPLMEAMPVPASITKLILRCDISFLSIAPEDESPYAV